MDFSHMLSHNPKTSRLIFIKLYIGSRRTDLSVVISTWPFIFN